MEILQRDAWPPTQQLFSWVMSQVGVITNRRKRIIILWEVEACSQADPFNSRACYLRKVISGPRYDRCIAVDECKNVPWLRKFLFLNCEWENACLSCQLETSLASCNDSMQKKWFFVSSILLWCSLIFVGSGVDYSSDQKSKITQ